MKISLALLILFHITNGISQVVTVVDENLNSLHGATLFVLESQNGYVSDNNGNLALIEKFPIHGIVRFLGYETDTIRIDVMSDKIFPSVIKLKPKDLSLKMVVVYGEKYTYAQRLLLAAIEAKKERNKDIISLEFKGYHRFKIIPNHWRGTGEKRRYIEFPPQESLSNNFWTVESGVYREIIGQKLIPLLTFDLQQFYAKNMYYTLDQEEIFIGNHLFKSPLAEDAISYFQVELSDSTVIDGNKQYKLWLEPKNKNNTAFVGFLTIEDKSFHPIKYEAKSNRKLNANLLLNYEVRLEFSVVNQRAWLPTRFIETFGILPFGGTDSTKEMKTVMDSRYADYHFNSTKPNYANNLKYVNNLDNKTINFSTPHFDLIPHTFNEEKSYRSLDSVSRTNHPFILVNKGLLFWAFEFPKLPIRKTTDWINYRRVSGLSLGFGLKKKFATVEWSLASGYQFGSQDFWGEGRVDYLWDKITIGISAGNLLAERDKFNNIPPNLMTITSPFGSEEAIDFYKKKYTAFHFTYSPTSIISISLNPTIEKANTVKNYSDRSPFGSKVVRAQAAINDGEFSRLQTKIKIDNRHYQTLAFDKIAIRQPHSFLLQYEVNNSLNSNKYITHHLLIEDEYIWTDNLTTVIRLFGQYGSEKAPLHLLQSLSGLTGGYGEIGTFNNLPAWNYGGRKSIQGAFEFHTGDQLIPFANWFAEKIGRLDLIVIHQFGFADQSIGTGWISTYDKVYQESGIGLGGLFGVMRIDFLMTTQSIDRYKEWKIKLGRSMTF